MAKARARPKRRAIGQPIRDPAAPEFSPADTDKRIRFVEEYLCDSNGTQAAIRAGYAPRSAHVTASRLLTDAKVQAALAAGRLRIRERLQITQDTVSQELAMLAFANILDFHAVQPDGSIAPDFSRLTRSQAAAIQELTVEEFTTGKGDGARHVRRTKVKLASKREPLADLSRYVGMFKDDGGQQMTVRFIIEGLEPKAAAKV